MVEAARIAYRDYPTVVNEVPESGITYNNTMEDYARMDSQMQQAQKAIGGASDTAQICQSYYWSKLANNEIDEDCKQYYENTVILAVCAQLAIDGCKKLFAVDVNNDIQRIRNQPCMKREKDYPKFMKWTHDIPVTKNGKERPYDEIKKDKNKVKQRIDSNIICPMNWLQECLDKIQGADKRNSIPTGNYLVERPKDRVHPNDLHMSKIRKIIEDYDSYSKKFMSYFDADDEQAIIPFVTRTEEVIQSIRGIKTSQLTVYRLIETTLGIERNTPSNKIYKNSSKYIRKMLNILYQSNKEKFLSCFINI